MSTEISEAIAAMILERQSVRAAETARRTAARKAERADHQRRRKFGVDLRNAATLARNRTAGPVV